MEKLARISLYGDILRSPESDTYFLRCYCTIRNVRQPLSISPHALSAIWRPLTINTGVKEFYHKPITREDIPPGYFRYGN